MIRYEKVHPLEIGKTLLRRRRVARMVISAFVAVVLGLTSFGQSMAAPGSTPTVERPPGVAQPVEPFAALPFHHSVAPKLQISSGWHTAEDEMPAILDLEHWALDFEGPLYGTPILAIADGWAVASYQSGRARGGVLPYSPADPLNPDRDWKDPVNEREGWLGYSGLFVELQTDVPLPGFQNITAQYFHLAKVNPAITWVETVRQDNEVTWDGKVIENWYPAGIVQSQADIRKVATRIKKGDVLGWMGDTGVNFGYNDAFDPSRHIVKPRNRLTLPPWDLHGTGPKTTAQAAKWAQLHIEFYGGRNERLSKIGRFDAMDLYAQITGKPGTSEYNNPYNPRPGKFPMGERPLFKRDCRGNPVFAG